MKKSLFVPVLAAAAAALAALCFAGVIDGSPLPLITGVPWMQLAALLRKLSLGSGTGNVLAIVLYAAVSLLPLLALALIRRKRPWAAEDLLLAALSALLFYGLYTLINPGRLAAMYGVKTAGVITGLVIWGMLAGYGLLRLVRRLFGKEDRAMWRAAAAVLWILALLFVYAVFGGELGRLLASVRTLRDGNTGAEAGLLRRSELWLVLQYMAEALPLLLNVWVIGAMLALLRQMADAPWSEASLAAADKLGRRCGVTLAATVVVQLVMAVAQLLVAPSVLQSNLSLSLPLGALTFTLAALILSRLLRRGKALQDDNDLFV